MSSFTLDKITYSKENIGVSGINIKAGSKDLLKNESLSLKRGRKYGIIGRNGKGKTSLLKGLHSFLKGHSFYIDQYIHNTLWKDINIVDAILQSNEELKQILFDMQQSDEWNEYLQEQISVIDIDKNEAEVKKILHGLGFKNEEFTKSYYEFSGGWKTRVNLARALYMKPPILLLDEPTNHLDMEALIWLEKYISNFDGIIVFVSHNIRFLNIICTDIVHIYNSKLCQYTGSYKKFKKQFEMKQKKEKEDYDKLQKEIKALIKKNRKKEADSLEKKRTEEGISRPEKPYKILIDFDGGEQNDKLILSIEDVVFGYTDTPILKNVNFSLRGGEKITIVGKNGCGKSTLIKLIMDPTLVKQGSIRRFHKVKTSYFHQHSIEELPDDLTPVEYMKEKYPSLSSEEIRQYLGRISLESEYHVKKMHILSGGQKMRIAFVDIIIQHPDLLLLDEPTNHLDLETIECLIDAINDYTGAVIMITHDINIIEETDSLVYDLSDGSLKFLNDGIDEYLESIDTS
jgi:ATPase subunit of ABC transporter with duplicated ATPase domains